jgi:hypothetical protein
MQIAITLELFLPKILKFFSHPVNRHPGYYAWLYFIGTTIAKPQILNGITELSRIAYYAEFILQQYLQYQNSQKKLS